MSRRIHRYILRHIPWDFCSRATPITSLRKNHILPRHLSSFGVQVTLAKFPGKCLPAKNQVFMQLDPAVELGPNQHHTTGRSTDTKSNPIVRIKEVGVFHPARSKYSTLWPWQVYFINLSKMHTISELFVIDQMNVLVDGGKTCRGPHFERRERTYCSTSRLLTG